MPCCEHHTPILFDFGPLKIGATDAALDALYKAIGDPPGGDDDGIWKPHHSPFVQRLIEEFTKRGLKRLADILEDLAGLAASRGKPKGPPPEKMMERWGPNRIAEVKQYLDNKPVEDYTLDDWMKAVDWIVQRYLPAGVAKTEAEWLTARAVLMSKVQTNLGLITVAQADAILSAIPQNVTNPLSVIGNLSRLQAAAFDYGQAHCAELIVALTDALRHKIKQTILTHEHEVYLGERSPALQTLLFDEFAELNRDWRRIAVTEAGEMMNQGVIASMEPGTQVKRIEMYDACPFCAKIHGRVLTVVAPDQDAKDGDTQVWVGKTNVGRSASPRKRVGDLLIEREPDELWWVAAGVQHPHCRGNWVVLDGPKKADETELDKWGRDLMVKLRAMKPDK